MEYRVLTNIEEMGNAYAAENEELNVSRDKGQPIIAILLFGLVIIYGFYQAFFKNAAVYVQLGIIAATIFFIRMIVADRKKTQPVLTINAAGIHLSGKDHYAWNDIREIIYETDEDGKGTPVLMLYLFDGEKVSFDMNGYLDQPIDAIAAYINRYWKRGE